MVMKGEPYDDYVFNEIKLLRAQLEQERVRWIPASERLPEEDKVYVICTDGTHVRELFYRDHSFLSGVQDQTSKVTHWMPLPAPPEGVERNE